MLERLSIWNGFGNSINEMERRRRARDRRWREESTVRANNKVNVGYNRGPCARRTFWMACASWR